MTLEQLIREISKANVNDRVELSIFSTHFHLITTGYVNDRPVCMVKTPRVPEQSGSITAEARALRGLEKLTPEFPSKVRVPRVLFEGTVLGRAVLVTTFEPGLPVPSGHGAPEVGSIAEFVTSFAERTAHSKGGLPSALSALLVRAKEELSLQLSGSWGAIGAGLEKVPLVLVHGDLSPLNVLISEESLTVVDWECSRSDGLPLADLIDYLLYCENVSGKDYVASFNRVFSTPSELACRTVRAYCSRIGIGNEAFGILAHAALLEIALRVASRQSARSSKSDRSEKKLAELIGIIQTFEPQTFAKRLLVGGV